jgi:hypothetical protein
MSTALLEDLIIMVHDYARIMEKEEGFTTESMFLRRTADTLSNMVSDKKYIAAIRETK